MTLSFLTRFLVRIVRQKYLCEDYYRLLRSNLEKYYIMRCLGTRLMSVTLNNREGSIPFSSWANGNKPNQCHPEGAETRAMSSRRVESSNFDIPKGQGPNNVIPNGRRPEGSRFFFSPWRTKKQGPSLRFGTTPEARSLVASLCRDDNIVGTAAEAQTMSS